jgi:hypothetical protein
MTDPTPEHQFSPQDERAAVTFAMQSLKDLRIPRRNLTTFSAEDIRQAEVNAYAELAQTYLDSLAELRSRRP